MIGGGRFAGSLAYLRLPVVPRIDAWLGYRGGLLVGRNDGGALATTLQFWPVAMVAGLATWLIHLRNTRWSRLALDRSEPIDWLQDTTPECEPPAAPDLLQVQGADLAARARFVAMTFAFPEVDTARQRLQGAAAGWPLHIDCQPIRFTLTLQHAALGYRLEFCNRGADALGPLIIRADLVAAGNRLAQDYPVEFTADALPVCHYLDSLPAGDSVELAGDLRLPLANIAALRLGKAELLVPLLRLCAESAGESRPAFNLSTCFAIGMPPLSAGGGIQPFRLDAGPGIWRKLSARRLVVANFP